MLALKLPGAMRCAEVRTNSAEGKITGEQRRPRTSQKQLQMPSFARDRPQVCACSPFSGPFGPPSVLTCTMNYRGGLVRTVVAQRSEDGVDFDGWRLRQRLLIEGTMAAKEAATQQVKFSR